MSGTADNFDVAATAVGPGKLYVDLGGASNGIWDGAAGVRLILSSDGTPDHTQNPNARHVGLTAGGADYMVKPTFTNFFADEFIDPIITKATAEEAAISGSFLQVLDMSLLEIMNPTAVRSDVMGTQGMTFGSSGIVSYTSAAVIFPLESDPTLFGVFHLYKCFNDAGLAAKITQKALAENPFALRGLAVSTRAAGDRVGRIFKQLAAGS
jgi:hypothetical protein